MLQVPKMNQVDVVFGNTDHLPKWDDIPESFRTGWSSDREPHCKFVSDWFYGGRTPADLSRLHEKDGVDRTMALAAVMAVLGSFSPKHEHKIAACGYMLSEWFDLDGNQHAKVD